MQDIVLFLLFGMCFRMIRNDEEMSKDMIACMVEHVWQSMESDNVKHIEAITVFDADLEQLSEVEFKN